jgi:hypothetical protein
MGFEDYERSFTKKIYYISLMVAVSLNAVCDNQTGIAVRYTRESLPLHPPIR